MTTQEILQRLERFDFGDDNYLNKLDMITEDLNKIGRPLEAVDPILRFIENHPDEDLGMPGSLVHFVEQFLGNGYEEILVASLRRCPTRLGVWMLNRLLNGLNATVRAPYVDLMKELSRSKDESVASEARFFLGRTSWA